MAIDSFTPSNYLHYLPAIYQGQEFLGRFLRIFDDLLTPDEILLDNLTYALDARYSPAEILPWLAALIDLTLDENWNLEKRRQLVRQAAWLYRWRGTRKGLFDFLKLYLGEEGTIEILENKDIADKFLVRVKTVNPSLVSKTHLSSIIEAAKPAHTTYELEIL